MRVSLQNNGKRLANTRQASSGISAGRSPYLVWLFHFIVSQAKPLALSSVTGDVKKTGAPHYARYTYSNHGACTLRFDSNEACQMLSTG